MSVTPAAQARALAPRPIACWLRRFAPGALLCALACAGYLRTGPAPFVWDDLPHIVDNPRIARPVAAWDWLQAGTQETRPLLNLSFAVSRAVFGLEPGGWRATNVALHTLCAWLLWRVLRRRMPALLPDHGGGAHALAAWLGAAWFAVHPLATEAVTYINSRSVLMASAAMLAAWLQLERRRAGVASGAAWSGAVAPLLLGVALLAKEMAVMLPLLIAWCDGWAPLTASAAALGSSAAPLSPAPPASAELAAEAPTSRRGEFGRTLWRRLWRCLWRRDVRGLLPALLVVPALFLALRSPHTAHIGAAVGSPVDAALAQPAILLRLLALAVLPIGQSLDHDARLFAWDVDDALRLGLSLGFWALCLGLAWRLRQRFPAAIVGVGGLLLAMAPTNSLVPFFDAMCERHLYPGLWMAAFGVGPCLGALSGWVGVRMGRSGLAVVPAAALLTALLGATLARNELWRDPVALWLDAAEKSPDKARPAGQLGATLAGAGWLEAAQPALERAVRLEPHVLVWRQNLGLLYRLRGAPEREIALWEARVAEAPADLAAARALRTLRGAPGRPPRPAADPGEARPAAGLASPPGGAVDRSGMSGQGAAP